MKICLLFFGITRSLHFTIDSIRQNIISPARKLGDVSILCHFFQLDQLINQRSRENGTLDPEEYKLLRPDWISLEPPHRCLAQWNFEQIARHGDAWDDDFASLKNLLHQLHSLHRVTEHALQQKPDLVLFCRPDLLYHDSLEPAIRRVKSSWRQTVLIPDWQWWWGLNDRFAVVRGKKAIRAYGQRIEKIPRFLAQNLGALHGETLLKFSLYQDSISYEPMPARASRVRLGGVIWNESFLPEAPTRPPRGLTKFLPWCRQT